SRVRIPSLAPNQLLQFPKRNRPKWIFYGSTGCLKKPFEVATPRVLLDVSLGERFCNCDGQIAGKTRVPCGPKLLIDPGDEAFVISAKISNQLTRYVEILAGGRADYFHLARNMRVGNTKAARFQHAQRIVTDGSVARCAPRPSLVLHGIDRVAE